MNNRDFLLLAVLAVALVIGMGLVLDRLNVDDRPSRPISGTPTEAVGAAIDKPNGRDARSTVQLPVPGEVER